MVFSFADNREPNSLASQMRRRRLAMLFDLFHDVAEPVRILDVGGTVNFWKVSAPQLPKKVQITLLNRHDVPTDGSEVITSVTGDARDMSGYGPKDFDIAFSNSVIEHVGTLEDQWAMAREVRRVASHYFIQTPYRYFPLEPHFLVPLWQFWPRRARVFFHRRFDLGWMEREPDPMRARADIEQIRLLTAREMQSLFPDGEVRKEKVGPLVKSLIAIGPRRSGQTKS